jgi:hypothetical protein
MPTLVITNDPQSFWQVRHQRVPQAQVRSKGVCEDDGGAVSGAVHPVMQPDIAKICNLHVILR